MPFENPLKKVERLKREGVRQKRAHGWGVQVAMSEVEGREILHQPGFP